MNEIPLYPTAHEIRDACDKLFHTLAHGYANSGIISNGLFNRVTELSIAIRKEVEKQ